MFKYLWDELIASLREMLFGVYVCTMREELENIDLQEGENK